jgi:hypothetical protein
VELCALCGEIPDMKEEAKKISVFPTGDKLPEMFSTYFIGQAYWFHMQKLRRRWQHK